MVAGEEETTSTYKKMAPETSRESLKFSNPKYSTILRGTQDDSRRSGLDIVKKSNDHLEKQTAPNSMSRVLPPVPETNHSEVIDQQKKLEDDFNASRNARDLSYDTINGNGTIAQGNNSAKGVTLKNDTVYLTSSADNATSISSNTSIDNSTSVSESATTINKGIGAKGTSNATVPTAILKNPKDNENKTKIDSSSSFAKKVTINAKVVKNTTLPDASVGSADKLPKISNVLVLNETHENSTDYISDQWNLNETSHNYNVTEDNSKNITLLSKYCRVLVIFLLPILILVTTVIFQI